MNTNSLAKHYDALTLWERLPLIMAAAARADEAEQSWLVSSAPKVAYRVPDYFGSAKALKEISDLYYMEMLDLAASYLQSMGIADTADEKQGMEMLDAALLLGYTFNLKLAGWRQFCAGRNLDPELCWSLLPGFAMLKRAEKLAEKAAFYPEGVIARLKQNGVEDPQLITPADPEET